MKARVDSVKLVAGCWEISTVEHKPGQTGPCRNERQAATNGMSRLDQMDDSQNGYREEGGQFADQ